MTRLLKPLQEKGFIELSANHEKPRYKKVTITRKGTETLNKIMDKVKGTEQFPFNMSRLTTEELNTFLKYGQKILGVHKDGHFLKMLTEARVENYDYA
ncbi:hypothetical protein [Cytobacillus sp. NCCP-133]|uniref:hypothetical protein n=1 Tax=Cytobacillus sp. NCCP-133 TaxID=766848 RepID=UPI00222F28DC|nr:hypothetical protein [Cytobacillus sp. NCCP-133]GLB62060.1 hypothetical protein NCCP133_41890 [Cytobacillus sp. NCCP-133]